MCTRGINYSKSCRFQPIKVRSIKFIYRSDNSTVKYQHCNKIVTLIFIFRKYLIKKAEILCGIVQIIKKKLNLFEIDETFFRYAAKFN